MLRRRVAITFFIAVFLIFQPGKGETAMAMGTLDLSIEARNSKKEIEVFAKFKNTGKKPVKLLHGYAHDTSEAGDIDRLFILDADGRPVKYSDPRQLLGVPDRPQVISPAQVRELKPGETLEERVLYLNGEVEKRIGYGSGHIVWPLEGSRGREVTLYLEYLVNRKGLAPYDPKSLTRDIWEGKLQSNRLKIKVPE